MHVNSTLVCISYRYDSIVNLIFPKLSYRYDSIVNLIFPKLNKIERHLKLYIPELILV